MSVAAILVASAVAGTVALWLRLPLVIAYVAVRAELRGQVDDQLRAQADFASAAAARVTAAGAVPPEILTGPPNPATGPPAAVRVIENGDTVIERGGFNLPGPTTSGERVLSDEQLGGKSVRVLTAPIGDTRPPTKPAIMARQARITSPTVAHANGVDTMPTTSGPSITNAPLAYAIHTAAKARTAPAMTATTIKASCVCNRVEEMARINIPAARTNLTCRMVNARLPSKRRNNGASTPSGWPRCVSHA